MSKKTNVREPEVQGFNYDEFFNNRLSLPQELKDKLKGEGKDWRFINSSEFKRNGNLHQSHWKPYVVTGAEASQFGAEASGMITRGDLLLAVRDKGMTKAHRTFLDKRNAIQQTSNKDAARKLRQAAMDYGVSEQTKIYEGYDDNE
jgi:hypothetical protein